MGKSRNQRAGEFVILGFVLLSILVGVMFGWRWGVGMLLAFLTLAFFGVASDILNGKR